MGKRMASENYWVNVNAEGHLILPPELVEKFGLVPGARVRIENSHHHLKVHRPATHLQRVYIEPTDLCNLECKMCIRAAETFEIILEGIKKISPRPEVFFGGQGEPLYHPNTIEWVAQLKAIGVRVELITNGTLLTEKVARCLIEAGLDTLWVSIDGASPDSYADIRLGAALPQVVDNLSRFRRMRRGSHHPQPEIGIAFVAMRRNIQDLPAVIKLGSKLGAKHFLVSNVLPYTPEMQEEQLYRRTLNGMAYLSSRWLPQLSLPKMDIDSHTQEAIFKALNSGYSVNFAGNDLSGSSDVCKFIAGGTMSIAWDGGVSPCWPLMHSHTSYLHGKEHFTRRHVVANVAERELADIWLDEDYVEYRAKVQGFKFAPCTFCGGCDLSEKNEEDCLGNGFPACGSCLWSQGVIQCP